MFLSKWSQPRRVYTRAMLGLPDGVTVLLFDLDGVLTDTASVHQKCWKEMFDSFLRERDDGEFQGFTSRDYERYVDGKPGYGRRALVGVARDRARREARQDARRPPRTMRSRGRSARTA